MKTSLKQFIGISFTKWKNIDILRNNKWPWRYVESHYEKSVYMAWLFLILPANLMIFTISNSFSVLRSFRKNNVFCKTLNSRDFHLRITYFFRNSRSSLCKYFRLYVNFWVIRSSIINSLSFRVSVSGHVWLQCPSRICQQFWIKEGEPQILTFIKTVKNS